MYKGCYNFIFLVNHNLEVIVFILFSEITKPALGYLSGVPPTPRPCILKSLDRTPVPIYLPDGSVPNSLYNVSKTGTFVYINQFTRLRMFNSKIIKCQCQIKHIHMMN